MNMQQDDPAFNSQHAHVMSWHYDTITEDFRSYQFLFISLTLLSKKFYCFFYTNCYRIL